MKPSFATAPIPFELTVDQVSEQCVKWSNSGDFPARWADTTIEWTLTPTDDGTLVRFSHDGWTSDEGSFPRSAMAWAPTTPAARCGYAARCRLPAGLTPRR